MSVLTFFSRRVPYLDRCRSPRCTYRAWRRSGHCPSLVLAIQDRPPLRDRRFTCFRDRYVFWSCGSLRSRRVFEHPHRMFLEVATTAGALRGPISQLRSPPAGSA